MTNEEEKYTTLDTEQCKWWVNQLFGIAKEKACNSHNFDDAEEMQSAQDKIIKALEMVEEFEKAQIITVGRLNERTYAFKCGQQKMKALMLEKIKRAVSEIESNMESIVGAYDANTPESQLPSRKIERNKGRYQALVILNKLIVKCEVESG